MAHSLPCPRRFTNHPQNVSIDVSASQVPIPLVSRETTARIARNRPTFSAVGLDGGALGLRFVSYLFFSFPIHISGFVSCILTLWLIFSSQVASEPSPSPNYPLLRCCLAPNPPYIRTGSNIGQKTLPISAIRPPITALQTLHETADRIFRNRMISPVVRRKGIFHPLVRFSPPILHPPTEQACTDFPVCFQHAARSKPITTSKSVLSFPQPLSCPLHFAYPQQTTGNSWRTSRPLCKSCTQ